MYDPALGRFISEDPIGFAGGDINLYGYVKNKPVNFFDPFGLDEYSMMERLGNQQSSNRTTTEALDDLQMRLGVLGMVPVIGEPCDAADGIISLLRGDYAGAGLSGASMVPYFGWGAGITKITRHADELLPAVKKIHGNDLNSPRPTWGYKLYQNDDTFLKNGITSNPVPETRYPKDYMSGKYMKTDPEPFPNRREAATWERNENLIDPGPLNFEPYIKRNNNCGCK
jgi:uncharacterized protein RhaS with RHS repeats